LPEASINHISGAEARPKAIRELSGDKIAPQASSCNFLSTPPATGRIQIPVRSLGPAGPLTSSLVPSWNQVTTVHRKQYSSFGGGIKCVSPVSIRRTWMPAKSV
jgi:hypothetical protein